MLQVSHLVVDRILGRYTDTQITVSETSSQGAGGQTHNSAHVHATTGYSSVFEADGMTFKFTDTDHVILEPGDRISIAWDIRPDGLRQVVAMVNESRGIRRPCQVEWGQTLAFALVALVFFGVFAFFGLSDGVGPVYYLIELALLGLLGGLMAKSLARKKRYATAANRLIGL